VLEEAAGKHLKDPQLYRVEADRVLVVGDTHGDVFSSLAAARREWDALVFLGDYVDRGPYQVENIVFLLALELVYPDRVYLVRGNHESPLMNSRYGFKNVVASRYGREAYKAFERVFSNMSYAALIDGRILGVHGGIARGLRSIGEIESLPKNDSRPSDPRAFEILWNDPDESVEYFEPNTMRGPGTFLYGWHAVDEFLRENGLELLLRAHQPFPEGFREHFGGRVITIFSCRFYPIDKPVGLMVENGEKKIVDLTE